MHYTDFPEAPASVTVLCEIDDIADGLHSACLGGFAYLVLDSANGPRAYVNACPHQFLPLDHRGDQVIGADGRLLCTNHNAAFDAQTGEGVDGFGLGCALVAIPLRREGKRLLVA